MQVVDSTIQIKDTGKRNTVGSVIYTQVNSGNWISLYGFTLTGEFTVNTTNNVTQRNDTGDSTLLTFESNEVAAIQAPRLTLRGLVPAASTSTITNIINLGRTKGIKQLAGGLGFIDAMPEVVSGTPNYIYVIVKNITFTEAVGTDNVNIAFTIQLEQVQ